MSRRGVAVTLATLIAVGLLAYAAGGGEDRRIALPAALPADVPLPDGARLASVQDRGAKGINIVLESTVPVRVLAGQLRERLVAGGWNPLSEIEIDDAVFSSYRHGVRTLAYGFSGAGGLTLVGVTYYRSLPDIEEHPG